MLSTVDPSTASSILARELNEGRLVAMVGAAASAPYTDRSGRTFRGLPTVSSLLTNAQRRFTYLKPHYSFEQTFDAISSTEGRARVEEFLLQNYNVSATFPAPPCQRMLAWLPFSAYITSNYDNFIERNLSKEGKANCTLIDNPDLVRLHRGHIPVVKYHGCVSRPSTMVACTLDYEHLERERKLLRSYMAAFLAGKTILAIGHGLNDSDFRRMLLELTSELGGLAPAIYLLKSPNNSEPNHSLGNIAHSVISEDLTEFLSRLQNTAMSGRSTASGDRSSVPWLNSIFFSELRKAAALPTETQVIDAFLRHLRLELSNRADTASVIADAEMALEQVLQARPNYSALRRIWDSMIIRLQQSNSPQGAELVVQDVISNRDGAIRHFHAFGASLISRNERILLYSQSERVLQVLRGVPATLQRNIHLYVSECRPKSPTPYQDAAATVKSLADTQYKVTICPDVVALSLLSTNQIDRVILGTHAVYTRVSAAEQVLGFVNTSGSLGVCAVAANHAVRVNVIGEALKVIQVPENENLPYIDLHQEEELSAQVTAIRDLQTEGGEVGHLNLGYDLVTATDNMEFFLPGN